MNWIVLKKDKHYHVQGDNYSFSLNNKHDADKLSDLLNNMSIHREMYRLHRDELGELNCQHAHKLDIMMTTIRDFYLNTPEGEGKDTLKKLLLKLGGTV